MNEREEKQSASRDRNSRRLLGMCIGLALGVSLGVALDSIPIGIGMGAGVGAALAVAFSGEKHEPSRPLRIAGVLLLLVGVVVLALVMSLVLPRWWCDYPILNVFPGC